MRLGPAWIVVALLATAVVTTVALRREPPFAPASSLSLLSAPPQQTVPLAHIAAVYRLPAFSRESDEEHSVTWYRPRVELPSSHDDIYLYYGGREGGFTEPMLLIQRMRTEEADTARRVVVEVDGQPATLYNQRCIDSTVVTRSDHTPAGVPRDTITFGIVSHEDVATIRAMANAQRVVIRYNGTMVTEEKVVPAEQLKSMREVIAIYEVLTGKPWQGEQLPELDCG